MRKVLLFVCLSLVLIPTGFSVNTQALLKICGHPASPCKSKHKEFAPYELSMVLPARVKQNTAYKSEVFYAVILKDKIAVTAAEECDGGEFHTKVETERKKVQARYPGNKVFAAHQCPDMAAIGYLLNGQPYNENFLAIYGGTTAEEANLILLSEKARYPKATLKKMQAVFENIVQ